VTVPARSSLDFLRERDIFHRMFKVTGSPTAEQAECCPVHDAPPLRRVSRFFGSYMLRMLPRQSRQYELWKQILAYHVSNPQQYARCNFKDTFKSCSEECCSLLSDMLQIDDRIRATAAQCFRSLHLLFFSKPEVRNLPTTGTPSSSAALTL
jgi:hypothetical protein